jgi:serine/threonine-protein kinase
MSPTTPPKLGGELGLRVAPVVAIGSLIDGRYRVESVLGRGGMGLVVAAREEPDGRRVAVKLLSRDPGDSPAYIRRALREAQAAGALRSEHATHVLRVGQLDSGLPYIVMELLEGQDFERLLAERGSLPLHEVATYLVQACDAIVEAHSHGIVHRDLKPSNLFLSAGAGAARVKLMDFGISKILHAEADTSLTNTHDSPGTPRYMSPEQLLSARQVDSRTDVWALGVIAFRMLAGRHPFDGETPAAVHIAIASSPTPRLRDELPHLPPQVARVIERCLVKSCNERLQTAVEFATVLMPYADEETQRRCSHLHEGEAGARAIAFSAAAGVSVGPNGKLTGRRARLAPFAIGAVALAAMGGLLFSRTRHGGAPSVRLDVTPSESTQGPADTQGARHDLPVPPSLPPSTVPAASATTDVPRAPPRGVRRDLTPTARPKPQPPEHTPRDPYADRR